MARPVPVTLNSQKPWCSWFNQRPADFAAAHQLAAVAEQGNGGPQRFAAALAAEAGPVEQQNVAFQPAARELRQLRQPAGIGRGGDDDRRRAAASHVAQLLQGAAEVDVAIGLQ